MSGSDLCSKYSKVSSPALAKAGWVLDYNLSADQVRNMHSFRSLCVGLVSGVSSTDSTGLDC